MGLVDDKAYAIEARLNALMGRVGLVDAGGNPETVSGAGWTGNTTASKLAQVNNVSGLATAALTSCGFTVVPGGDVEAGTTYKIHASGFYSTGASAPTGITFGVFWDGIGGTNVASATPSGTIGNNITAASWYLDAEVNWKSGTEAEVTLVLGWRNANGIANSLFFYTVADTTGLVTNATKNLSVGVQWSSAPAGTSFGCDICRFERKA